MKDETKAEEKDVKTARKKTAPKKRSAKTASRKQEETGSEEKTSAKAKKKRVNNLKKYTKQRAGDEWEGIVKTMVTKAKRGSVPHAKFLVDVSGAKDEPVKSTRRKLESLAGHLQKNLDETKKSKSKEQKTESAKDGAAAVTDK